MNELEESLNAVLSDPEAMQRIMGLAAGLMGGGETGPGPAPSGDKTALLAAMAPYLGSVRREKLEKALRMAHLARLARTALEEYGGGTDV